MSAHPTERAFFRDPAEGQELFMFSGLCQTSLFPEWMAAMATEEQWSFLLSPASLGPLSSRSPGNSFMSMGKKNVQPTPPVAHVREGPEPVYKLSFVSLPLYSLGMYASWNKVIYLDLG